MTRFLAAMMLTLLLPLAALADGERLSDGSNEIVAVVDGTPITYQDVIGKLDLAIEVRTMRQVRRIPDNVTDQEIERAIVYSQIEVFIINRLLLNEARKVRVDANIRESDVRALIKQERSQKGIADGDEIAWANYLQEKYSITPSEYRDRKRTEVIQQQMIYVMAGGQGNVPTEYPLSVYFPLNISPKDLRKAFNEERKVNKNATQIDYRSLKVIIAATTTLGDRKKLYEALVDAQSRARAGESLESAAAGLKILEKQMGLIGLKVVVGERKIAKSQADLDDTAYQLVLSLPERGGISDIAGIAPFDENDVKFEGYELIQLFSKREGDAITFDDPQWQSTKLAELQRAKLDENIGKVQRALLKRAVIVPSRLIAR
ncbi:MAG: SurA N-terminal domain-containing protein [Planctomycetes bacterium]|nr:SurA N-terminal domain-containing protein [Planctomycetota bacterium]CAG0975406.1 hypothetical protein PLCT2_01589 [Planctomycetaceae bacterium]